MNRLLCKRRLDRQATLLTKRLLRLLAAVEQGPEECLAITFTRKAAGEMRDRVLAALEYASSSHPAPEEGSTEYQTWLLADSLLKRDKASGWNLLKNPSRLRIQTVDSFMCEHHPADAYIISVWCPPSYCGG